MPQENRNLDTNINLRRRALLKYGGMGALLGAVGGRAAFAAQEDAETPPHRTYSPMALGLLIRPFPNPEAKIRQAHEMGFSTCFLSLDGYLGSYSPKLAKKFNRLFDKYQIVPTAAEVVNPQPLKWNFVEGPSTIGLVPRAYRAARVSALKQTSDFARALGVDRIQTHCGFIPEDPQNPLYGETVDTIKDLAEYCSNNGQKFLMETGQETPTTMLRTIKDVNHPALGVGLDTANLILYGKANPVDAVKILGSYVQAVHAKDGKWPTNPNELGEEVIIGSGDVDFSAVLAGLRAVNYSGAISIERETSGPQQVADVKKEKIYLERIISQL